MESMQQRVEAWIKEQRTKISNVSWPPLQQWRTMRWPWKNYAEHRKRIQEEYEWRKKQVHDLCLAVKADSVSDLRDVLCCMVLSECVYKRPASEVVRAVNKFKADFGGQIVSLERVQPSSDHVTHRYLLAEAGDTLFASFIGTKQYKDIMADANILQGAIFHEDVAEYVGETEATESDQVETQQGIIDILMRPLGTKPGKISQKPKPAAHRGFLARAKGIPALELYRLAQKKKRKLVLCGHSLGGAVAVLATLAILRVVAASSSLKENENENVQVKCITFSQPPVGNAALRDHVIGKKWHHYFKTYCIPEDLVPRILSPAYFRHYNDQPLSGLAGVGSTSLSISKHDGTPGKSRVEGLKENEGEQLVLGLGPVQSSLWRLSKLVPLEGVWGQFNRYRGKQVDPVEKSSDDSVGTSSIDDVVDQPQSLEIQEGFDSISLQPISDMDKGMPIAATNGKLGGKNNKNYAEGVAWHRVPSLPSYVPFGQLYLLGNSSVESLSGSEYSQLTSVKSVITELRERLQSHSMKSYRSRFQRIYDLCMNGNASSFLGMDQFPYLQQWFGLSVSGAVELGHIVDSPVICAATSVAPLGWSGIPGEKNVEPLKVDITGFGLHLCTLVQAQVNGNWCSATVESFPSAPNYFSSFGLQQDLQKIRVLIGPALKQPPKHKLAADALVTDFSSIGSNQVNLNMEHTGTLHDGKFICPEGLSNVVIHCTSDFSTISKEVHIRTRRVRLVGLEGAGKSSLLRAILGQNRLITTIDTDNLQLEDDLQEGISGGLCYTDSAGVNLQELNMEASRFRDELWMGIRDLSKKVDLILLVHNLSHKIPCFNHTDGSQQQPALVLLLNEAKALGIPWVLAITNKFSVSAHQQKTAVDAVLQAYKASASSSGVVNSCPYVMPTAADAPLSFGLEDGDSDSVAQKLLFAPINLVRRPFQKKPTILPVEGVTALRQIVHRVLQIHEEASLQELARERLLLELAQERTSTNAKRDSEAKPSSLTAATVGASLGAGLGLVMAVVMGAFSALRKP